MYQVGYEATMKAMPKIKELVKMCEKREFNFLNIFKRNKKKYLNDDNEILEKWLNHKRTKTK